MSEVPNPGSPEAIELGCTCPVLDNGHGQRVDGLFWMNMDCPIHGEALHGKEKK
jgi:hypothetical protein